MEGCIRRGALVDHNEGTRFREAAFEVVVANFDQETSAIKFEGVGA
jgi:hypothetical protein